jgi:hypothetical protein
LKIGMSITRVFYYPGIDSKIYNYPGTRVGYYNFSENGKLSVSTMNRLTEKLFILKKIELENTNLD